LKKVSIKKIPESFCKGKKFALLTTKFDLRHYFQYFFIIIYSTTLIDSFVDYSCDRPLFKLPIWFQLSQCQTNTKSDNFRPLDQGFQTLGTSKPMHILVLLTLGGAQLDKNLIGWGGGRNVEFHYYDWSFYSQRRNCLLSSSLLRQKSDF
jgi:hypothetical protein